MFKTGLAAFLLSLMLIVLIARMATPPFRFAPQLVEPACRLAGWQHAWRPPLYILPHVDGLDLSNPVKRAALQRQLDTLEPGGPDGQVRLGYTLTEQPLSYYTQHGKNWQLDLKALDRDLAAAAVLGRPFVFYPVTDHYQVYSTPLLIALRRDPKNLMQYRDGSVVDESFLTFHLTPFTLTNDEREPFAAYSFRALRAIADRLKTFDEMYPGLLVGVEVNGETHYLFHDFTTGTGDYDQLNLADYGDRSISGFAEWLKAHHRPEKAEDIRHIDFRHGESGLVPISGWISGPRKVDSVVIYVDGKKRGAALYPNSRMDVYQHAPTRFPDPNIGFGRWIDLHDLSPGQHMLQVVVTLGGKPVFEIGRRHLVVGSANDHKITSELHTASMKAPWEGSLDQPRNEYPLNYQPLAEDWLIYRAQTINSHVEAIAGIFRQAGFDERHIFSYQFAPWMVGGWNELLFGIGHDFFRLKGMLPGINTYNGSLMNPLAFSFLDTSRGYAIPETHPQMPGSEARITDTLHWQYCHGALFIGPYYLRPIAKKGPIDEYDHFRISPDNAAWGSDGFYRALRDLVRH